MAGLDRNTLENSASKSEIIRVAHWWRSKRGPEFLAPLLYLLDQPRKRFENRISPGQVVADLGCGWGKYSFMLANKVGPAGKVYSVDLAEKCIHKIQKKVEKRGLRNITPVTSSTARLSFIEDQSVDFVFANGLLCSMAVDRSQAVSEIHRILKPHGLAYLSLGAHPPLGYVDEKEWIEILSRFSIQGGGSFKDSWALVAKT